jgi:HlyD family secretion protein
VRRIAPYVLDLEKQARTVEVEVEIDAAPKDAPLLAGYSADIEVIVDRREAVLRVPTPAVRSDDEVLVLDPVSGLLQARKIEAGLSNWDQTEVSAGLSAGEQVVVSLDREGVEDGASAVVGDESAD